MLNVHFARFIQSHIHVPLLASNLICEYVIVFYLPLEIKMVTTGPQLICEGERLRKER